MKDLTAHRIADALEHLALYQEAFSERHLPDCPACSLARRKLNLPPTGKFKAVRPDDQKITKLAREAQHRRALILAEPEPEVASTLADSFRYRERAQYDR